MNKAVIFDMDGTMVDNAPYHKTAWVEYCRSKGANISVDDFDRIGFGLTSAHYIKAFINASATKQEIDTMDIEKEAFYRNLYRPYVKPVNGLIELIKKLKENNFKMAVATSAIPDNLNFILEKLKINEYFDTLVDVTQISHPKPHPEIFLKAANKLGVEPNNCLVFEDSKFGIKAANDAGMKIIVINTGKNIENLNGTIKMFDDFEPVSVELINKLIEER